MSLNAVREYFVTHAKALNFSEHDDAFAWDNIPSTKLHRAFFVEAFEFPGTAQNQIALEYNPTITVRLFFKAYRSVKEGVAMATTAAEDYVIRVLRPENRLTQLSIKNIVNPRITIEPFATSNDNAVMARIELTVKYFT